MAPSSRSRMFSSFSFDLLSYFRWWRLLCCWESLSTGPIPKAAVPCEVMSIFPCGSWSTLGTSILTSGWDKLKNELSSWTTFGVRRCIIDWSFVMPPNLWLSNAMDIFPDSRTLWATELFNVSKLCTMCELLTLMKAASSLVRLIFGFSIAWGFLGGALRFKN